MPRLPDIPLDRWWEDQQQRFQESTAGLLPSLEFEIGARESESQIPPDYDAVGGLDQWKEAEESLIERESRLAQQQDEERRQQEIEALAEQYRQQQLQTEAAEQVQRQEQENSVMNLIRGLGIPTPSEAFESFTSPGSSTTTTGAFDVQAPTSTVHGQPPSEVDQFNEFAGGMSTDAFGAPTPDPLQDRGPDNESTTGLLDSLGSAVQSGVERVRSSLTGPSLAEQTAIPPEERTPEQESLARMDEMYGGLGQGPRWLEENLGAAATARRENRMLELNLQPGEKTPEQREELARLEEERHQQVIGASGTMGGAGMADDAISAIKTLLSHGLDDAAMAGERSLAEKTSMTLAEIQQRTRGLPSTGAPKEADGGSVPSGTSVTPETPPASQSPVDSREVASFESRSLLGASRPLNREERVTAASEMLQTTPEKVEEAFQQALHTDPVQAGVTQEALHQRAEAKWAHWDDARQEWLDAKKELDDWRIQNPEAPASNLDDDVAARVSHWWAEMYQRGLEMFPSVQAPTMVARAASKQMNAQRGGRLGAIQVAESRQVRSIAETFGEAAEAAKTVAREGVVSEDALTKLGKLGTTLESEKNIRVITRRSKTARDIQETVKPQQTQPPRDETIAERLGRLKRTQGRLESMLDDAAPEVDEATRGLMSDRLTQVRSEIDDVLGEYRGAAREVAEQRQATKGSQTFTPEELERIADEAVGRRALGRVSREAQRAVRETPEYQAQRLEGQTAEALDKAIQRKFRDDERLQESIQRQVNRRIDGMLAQEKRAAVRAEVKQMAGDAQKWAERIRKFPDQRPQLEEEFDLILRRMDEHSNAGSKVAQDLRERLQVNLDEDLFRRTADEERRASEIISESRIRGIKQQIKEVLANPHAPGGHLRIAELYRDLADVNVTGLQEAARMGRHAQEAGILKSGIFADKSTAADKARIIELMSRVNPDDPKTFRPVQELMVRPNLWQFAREISFINLLSQPVTLATNLSSTAANIVLKGVVRGALEEVFSGGQLGGTKEFIAGVGRGTERGAKRLGTVMKTGIDPERLEDAVGRSEFRRVGREVVPYYLEKVAGDPGRWWGEKMHQISTRPQVASDALLGSMAYSGAFAREAARHADDLIRNRDPKLRTMQPVGEWAGNSPRDRAMAYIHQNPWDFPNVIEQAGKIEDYTLFRTRGKSWGETELRALMGLKEVPLDAHWGKHLGAAVFDFLMPFWNVPYNFTKQGLGNVAAPIEAIRAVDAYRRGDVKGGATKMAHATQGAAMLTIPYFLAKSDSLTGPGPKDAAQRRVWEQTHKPNSWYAPGYGWVSYEGTPWAIPFALMAGIKEGYEFGDVDENAPIEEQLGKGLINAGQGALRGIVSQSFLDSAFRNLSLATGDDLSSQGVASFASSTALRYQPSLVPSGTLNFLGQVFDEVQREAGRAREFGDIREVATNQIKSRLPFLREELPEKRDAYGEVLPNERSGLRAAAPRSLLPEPAPRQGDKITEQLEKAEVGIPTAPKEIPMGQGSIPLTIAEQQYFQQRWGQEYRKLLEEMGVGKERFSDIELKNMRDGARKQAFGAILDTLTNEDIDRRWKNRPVLEVEP